MSAERKIKRGWMNLRVTRIETETHDTVTLYLEDNEENGLQFDYIPGQYLTFRFDDLADKPVVRSYTMSSSPCEKNYSAITVKEVENGWISKHLVRDVKVGDVLRARGPIGRFCYEANADHPHLVMIAAGSGVTPFVSMLREYSRTLGNIGSPTKMTLLVCYKSQNDLICKAILGELQQVSGINIVTTLTRENVPGGKYLYGRISEPMIADLMQGSYRNATYMTCGPKDMMELVKRHLLSCGVDPLDVKTESFD